MSAEENCVLPLNKFGNSEDSYSFLMKYKIVQCVKEKADLLLSHEKYILKRYESIQKSLKYLRFFVNKTIRAI